MLVAGDRWKVQDLVSLCLCAGEVTRSHCLIANFDPEAFAEYARLAQLPYPGPLPR